MMDKKAVFNATETNIMKVLFNYFFLLLTTQHNCTGRPKVSFPVGLYIIDRC